MDERRQPRRTDWRPDLFVVARFLQRLWHEEGEAAPSFSKSRLQAAVRLNYDVFHKYLDFLNERGLVGVEEIAGGERRVSLTSAGRQAHERLVGWIREVFGPGALGLR